MIRVAAAILWRSREILICQRRQGGGFALKWEFPGGKVKEGETVASALVRELEEELGIAVPAGRLAAVETIRHRYPGGPEVEIHFFAVSEFSGEPLNRAFEKIAWVAPADLPGYDFLEADRPLVGRIAAGGVVCPVPGEASEPT
ncbi:MAG TPA: (deoxy)nucleoside triphosphate pyrophosphohydrolase [Candidatus Polarisedimenticolia bacterium]|nr:(deoxy)nucleoside triphosphate pyrophosphohydrolase [Candidatus Polarisedimenticolia bacterium]